MPATITSRLQRLALLNVCLGQFMTALDSRSIIVALPTLSIHFHSPMAVVQWIPLAYQLTIIGLVLSLARLGDMRGRKQIYGLGFLLLALGSVCSGLSAHLWQIIAFRVLAGLGGAMVLANGRAILSTVYAQHERGRALGFASMAFHLGYITGPSLAGLLIDSVGWRWIFFLNLPVALAASFMAWKVLPETSSKQGTHSLDPLGMLMLFSMAVSLILGLQQVAKTGISELAMAIFVLAATSAGLLVHVERKNPAPLLELSLFKVRVLTAGVLSHLFMAISHSSTFFLLPFYLQGILHFTPTQVGVTIIFFSLVIVFLAPLGGWLGDRLGSRLLCTTGSALSVISMVLFSRLASDSAYAEVMIPLMILGVGWSIFQAPNLSAIFSAVEPRYVGAVSGLSLTSANIANASGVAIASLLFTRWLNHYGLGGSVVPAYTQWGDNPAVFIAAFRSSWLSIAGLTVIAVVASSMRGTDRRERRDS